MKLRIRSILKWVSIAIAAFLIISQAVRPARTNPPTDQSKTLEATGRLTPEIAAIFDRSCRDCHSNQTVWPWYSNVAPISWLLANDVNEGRRELSFSNWSDYDSRRALRKLQQICDEVREQEMPMASYVLLHPEAKLSEEDRRLICEWANRERERLSQGDPDSER
jgi:hypothetical protein